MSFNVELFLNGIILCLSLISWIICTFILIKIFLRIHSILDNVPILLTSNTYFTILLGTSMMIIIYSLSIHNDLNSSLSYDDYTCQLRGYFIHVFICAFYYSCLFQATFRLFRIIFYTKPQLQTHYYFFIGMFIQWIVSFLYILIHLFYGHFQYSSIAHGCWISFKNVRTLFQALIVMYCGPILSLCFMYAYIIHYTRRTIHSHQQAQQQQRRQTRNKRDLLILKRIVILVLVEMGIGIATVFTLIIYLITDYLIPIAYHLQGLSISAGFFMGSFGFAFITPQVRQILLRPKRRAVRPIMIINVIARLTHDQTNCIN